MVGSDGVSDTDDTSSSSSEETSSSSSSGSDLVGSNREDESQDDDDDAPMSSLRRSSLAIHSGNSTLMAKSAKQSKQYSNRPTSLSSKKTSSVSSLASGTGRSGSKPKFRIKLRVAPGVSASASGDDDVSDHKPKLGQKGGNRAKDTSERSLKLSKTGSKDSKNSDSNILRNSDAKSGSSKASKKRRDSSDDEAIPVAVPVEEETEEAEVVATILDDDDHQQVDATASVHLDDEDSPKKKSKFSKVSSSSADNTGASSAKKPSSSSSGAQKPKSTSSLRAAAAAHRNRQIHVPPIGSPGLLIVPNPALSSMFASNLAESANDATSSGGSDQHAGDAQNKSVNAKNTSIMHNGYFLPRRIFQQSMISGGYTHEQRSAKPHRGSSTERSVGDMFDSDAGGLYLHFPDLIPIDLWEQCIHPRKKDADSVLQTTNGHMGEADDVGAEKIEKHVNVKREDDLEAVGRAEGTNELNHVFSNTLANGKVKEEAAKDSAGTSSSGTTSSRKGPRVVEVMIQTLEMMLGEKMSNLNDSPTNPPQKVKLEPMNHDTSMSIDEPVQYKNNSDSTSRNFPRNVPSYPPRTRKRCRPHEPMSFLDMIPISLTATYPADYVDKRRAFARAVRAREHAIIKSQEAADDAEEALERYQAHKEAWDRMLTYQKEQMAKKELDKTERKKDGSYDNEKKEPEKKSQNGNDAVKKADPMDCMPPEPQPPTEAPTIQVPEIPTPPSPPQVLEVDFNDDIDGYDHANEGHGKPKNDLINNDVSSVPMQVPKLKSKLLQHLDPLCFIPSMEGRYFGLISNGFADPQFVGPNAPGIRGLSSGGGTGLATSYVGGGRGAAGLVSGPLRGSSTWDSRNGGGSKIPSCKEDPAEDATTSIADDVTVASSDQIGTSAKTTSNRKDKKHEGASEGGKKRRRLPLATGDRKTTATEIASAPAGLEFPDGWIIKTYRRAGGETIGKTDRFWFSPGRNIRFRAKKHAKAFVEILREVGIDGDEDAAADIYRSRGLHF